jgi:hypothetical protein
VAKTPNAALPWDALKHTEGDIPWPALEQFAEALAANPSLWQDLRKLYDDYFNTEEPQPSYECLYVPAILALAAPRLGDDARREIAEFLVEELVAAGEEDDEVMMEVMETATGTMGPVALPAVLARLDELSEDDGEWYNIWSLTSLAADTDDPQLRKDVAERCVKVVEQAERDEIDPIDALMPAITLAKMRYTEARPSIERLFEKTDNTELRAVLATMAGKGKGSEWRNPWDQPVKEWLAAHWEALHEDYTSPPDEDEEEEDWEEGEDSDDDGFEDENPAEDEEPAPPVESKPTVGRNDPCPCGSGKKYKKCCGR